MALQPERSDIAANEDPEFDRWVVEMGGEEAVVAMIEDTRRRAAEGTLRGFHDEASYGQFLKDLGPGRRQSA